MWRDLLELTFHDELRESLWPDGGQRWFAVVTRPAAPTRPEWWDDEATDDEVETRDDVLRAAMRTRATS